MLKQRIISSILVILLTILVIFFFPNWVFCAVATWFIGMSLFEFYSMVEKKNITVYKYLGTFLGILVPIFTYLEYNLKTEGAVVFSIVLFSVFIFARQFAKKDGSDILASTAITLFGILYISWFFSFLIKLKYLPLGNNLVVFLLLLTEGGDAGAYFIGSAAGKHLLIPRISPKKSVEGAIGGFVTTLVLAALSKPFFPNISMQQLLIAGLLIGIIAPIGDLTESLFKRDCGVKDSGECLPGLGGVLDMIDSLLLAAPLLYFYITAFVM
ncbi:MAG: phosphatidate cytidylyltransferase [Candidatus Omnitrophica bacterium]|nr:phosphatidate cytidylyltransferase [Candidatus Omnitrophota bacterium]MBU4488480.1 phosphatidate cytidylyltransferase [Candidatus Omnitrophota bacterium]MCG2705363.1 phosphatidate cytidylyltransferase [Candidatus Omnitrophota bacterium]